MYNSTQKQAFINESVANRVPEEQIKRTAVLFKRISGFEESASKDVSEMNTEEVAALYQSGAFKKFSAHISLCILRSYGMWCVKNGYSAPSGLAEFIPDDIAEIRETMVSGDRQLHKHLDNIFSPVSDGTADNLIRAFLWIVFSGLHPREASEVTAANIDLAKRIVTSGGVMHKLSPLAMPSVSFAVNAESFAIDHPQYKSRKRIDGSHILRGTIKIIRVKDIRNRLHTAQKNNGNSAGLRLNITPTSVFKSGIFSEMYARERAGFPPDFSDEAEYLMRFRTEEFGTEYKLYGADFSEAYRGKYSIELLEEYSEWKIAFVQ